MAENKKNNTAKKTTSKKVDSKNAHHKKSASKESVNKKSSSTKHESKATKKVEHKPKHVSTSTKEADSPWMTASIILGILVVLLVGAIGYMYFNQGDDTTTPDTNTVDGDNNNANANNNIDDNTVNAEGNDANADELPDDVKARLQPLIDEYGFDESIEIKVITKDGSEDTYLESFFKQPVDMFLTGLEKEYISAQDENVMALIEKEEITKGPVLLFGKSIENMKGFKILDNESGLSGVIIVFEGQEMPLFLFEKIVELDGTEYYMLHKDMVSQITMTSNLAPLPQKDVPEVELFVMSHCPYGTQIEKGMLPVVKLLGDKIDFNLKFVSYAMHDKLEIDEQLNQYCVEQIYGKDKLIDYLECFLEAGDTDACIEEMEFDSDELDVCTKAADEKFGIYADYDDKTKWMGSFPPFSIHVAENTKYGVRGSPTLVVNGVEVTTGRDSQSLLKSVCEGFSETPEECETEFETGNPTPGFGYDETTQQNLATCG